MEFTLIDGKTKFQFPVKPEELTISRSKGYETINMLEHGEFDFAQGEKVKEITFSSFFPKEYDASYCMYEKDFPDPRVAMNMLNTFLVSKKPLRFIITNTGVNVPVYLISHNTTFRGGESGDIYFDITLRTWRDSKVEKVGGATSASKSGSRTDLKTSSKTYTVKSGDSLSKIAKLELGSSSKWNEIYKLNVKTIGSDPNRIKPGQKLVMP
ncbi:MULTISPECIES: LysM peptidoglycan-binding domain-containing protein [unclassified Paenibacillus]|uniref:LysM peptidoglycan-binding domain-containing protein n=1 Tax=unclassified Paenibacillus TaxID=185978 RepID=UPI0004635FE4|nr:MULTISPECIES: LysM peptidoglycan-binding domain-containing protein [unclassified Paenibacillus]KGP79367.1 terminase [Paenibacillus sp. MAEPY2]KGP86994.1 terminase [Paenibacillus sp. MAEPY1]